MQVRRELERHQPIGVLHLASLNLRACEADPVRALQVNVFGAYTVATEAERCGVPLVFVSSGAVFSGMAGTSFDEDSVPAPANVYGQSKRISEILLSKTVKGLLIVRAGWLYGAAGAPGAGFFGAMVAASVAGRPIVASNDQTGSPTYIPDFVAELRRLLAADSTGLVHVANEGVATAAAVAHEIKRSTGGSSEINELPASSIAGAIAQRSDSEALSSKTIHLRPWTEALAEYVRAQAPTLGNPRSTLATS